MPTAPEAAAVSNVSERPGGKYAVKACELCIVTQSPHPEKYQRCVRVGKEYILWLKPRHVNEGELMPEW